jgi:hypothetical protein
MVLIPYFTYGVVTINTERGIKMLERIKNLVSKIEENQKELDEIKSNVDKIEQERLKEVIDIARKGIKFEKIYKNKTTYNSNGSNYRDDDVEYFKSDNDCYLKGIKVDNIDIKTNKYGSGAEYQERELYLLSDGTFKVFYKESNISYFQGNNSSYSRTESKYQQLDQFDTDNIINNIVDALEGRLKDLGDRTKTQQTRLEKIEELVVK